MLEAIALSAAIGGCPKHVPHHKKAIPQCTCVADPPRTIVLPAPVLPDPDPIEIGVYRYYILAAAPVPTPDTPSEPWWEPVYSAVGTAFASSSAPVRAPEIDSTGAASGLTLLAGCLAVGMGRRK